MTGRDANTAIGRTNVKGVLHGIQATDKAPGAYCRSGGCSPQGQKDEEEQQAAAPAPAAADDSQDQAQYAPPPVDPADEIEHFAQLHASGVLSDEEFAAAKAKALGS